MDLHSWCGCLYEENLLFPNIDFNSFCSINLHDLTVNYIMMNPYESKDAFGLYAHGLQYGDISLFFPNNCRQIAVVERKNSCYRWIEIPLGISNAFYASAGEILNNSDVYLFPQKMDMGIWKIDIRDYTIKRCDDLNKLIEEDEQIPGSSFIDIGDGKGAYVTLDNSLRVFDIKTKDTKKYTFDEKYSLFRCFFHEDDFWFTQNKSTTILRWNIKKDFITEYSPLEEINWFRDGIPYSKLCFLNDKAIVLNNSIYDVMELYPERPEKGIVKAFSYPEGFGVSPGRLVEFAAVFDAFEIIDNKLYLIPSCADRMLVYDILTEKVNTVDFSINTEQLSFEPMINNYYLENPFYSLKKFINMVV